MFERTKFVATVILLCFALWRPVGAQGTDGELRSELEARHTKWFGAFDRGDGATMDQMEVDNLVLVMPNGTLFSKKTSRAGTQQKRDPQTQRTLTNVSVRRFGATAILTGVLTTKSVEMNSTDATTMVFVHSSRGWKIASAQWSSVAAPH